MRSVLAARAEIAAKPSRLVATVLAVLIGVGFASAALVFTSMFQSDFESRLSVEYSRADLVVQPSGDMPVTDVAGSVRSVPGVADAEPLYYSNLEYSAASSHGYVTLQLAARDARLRWAPLLEGHWPTDGSQVVLTKSAATATSLTIGSTMTITGARAGAAAGAAAGAGAGGAAAGAGADGQASEVTATVVGIADASASPMGSGMPTAFAPSALFTRLGVTYAPQIAVLADRGGNGAGTSAGNGAGNGAALSTLAGRIDSRIPGAVTRTVAEQAKADLQGYTGQTATLTTVLLGFAAIAMVVAGIVIVNTFTILLTGRRRQIGLLRCIGASRAQVRRQVLAEAAIVGAVGSLAGAAAGIGVGVAAASIAGLDAGGVSVPPVSIGVVVLIGVTLTVGAAIVPARRAIAVPPLVALRPVSDPETSARAGRARIVVGAALVAFGALGLVVGITRGSLLAAMPGGAISAVGVLVLSRSFLPGLLRIVGRIAYPAGVPGRLAATNAVRNPGRSAATSAALVVGVGLIVMLQVAAASVGASIDRAVSDRYPVDMVVAGSGDALPGAVVDGIAHTAGLTGTLAIHGAPATVQGHADLADDAITMIGVPADAGTIVRGGLADLSTDKPFAPPVLVPAWWVGSGQLEVGQRLDLTVGGRSAAFTVAVGHLTDAGVSRGVTLVTTQTALDRLAPRAPVVAVWGATAPGSDAAEILAHLNTLVADQPGSYVTGGVEERGTMQSLLNTVTTVATGLLAVAVVIAIIGIGNTIGLSVAERTRESALLRALGLRRGQLRLMLGIEATLLASVGAVVGLVLGLIYGWAGAATTFDAIGRELVLAVPWGRVALVLLVAVAAGALASVLPARRAVRTAPVEALAED